MNRKIILKMIKVILFLLFLSTCWMIYSTIQNMREGFAPTKCSEFGDCKACAGTITATQGDGRCAWDSKIGKCRKSSTSDDGIYVSSDNKCSTRTTFPITHSSGIMPTDAIWTDPEFGCPVCPTLHDLGSNSKITTQTPN
jgi:hypothetical protein